MRRTPEEREAWLPLSASEGRAEEAPTGEAFRPEWIDFRRGIRVGNLLPHERITRILKHYLETHYGTPFVTDRWGRGVYWHWICWLPRANREAKPRSSHVNFGCAKLFITVEEDPPVFKSGLQIERGYTEDTGEAAGWVLAPDWDWHRFVRQCRRGTALDRELRRLIVQEGFVAEICGESASRVFRASDFRSASQLASSLRKCPGDEWAGFQLYYPMAPEEVRTCSGYELVRAIEAVFDEVIPAMNLCMDVPLVRTADGGHRPELPDPRFRKTAHAAPASYREGSL